MNSVEPKALIRYPGSKAKLVRVIESMIPDFMTFPLCKAGFQGTYYEPFVGSGAVTSALLEGLPRTTNVILNDKDYWLVCLWNAVKCDPDTLCAMIDEFEPSADLFYEYKAQDGTRDIDPVLAGFRKLALHQTSFSGLGFMAGGPLGGKAQNNSAYYPSCRWKPVRLKAKIRFFFRLLNRFRSCKITCRDFSHHVKSIGHKAFVYLDPPYYVKGGELYKHNMKHEDHVRLSETLREAPFKWALSYDDCAEIRTLYAWAQFRPIAVTYTTATSRETRRPKNQEVLITP